MKATIADPVTLVIRFIEIPLPEPVPAKNHIAVPANPVLPYRHRKASAWQRWIQRRKEARDGA